MENFLIFFIILHALAIRLAFIFPVFRMAVGLALLSELLLILFIGSQDLEEQQQFYFLLAIVSLIAAILGGM